MLGPSALRGLETWVCLERSWCMRGPWVTTSAHETSTQNWGVLWVQKPSQGDSEVII